MRIFYCLIFIVVGLSADNAALRRNPYNYQSTNNGAQNAQNAQNHSQSYSQSGGRDLSREQSATRDDIIGTLGFVGVGISAHNVLLRHNETSGLTSLSDKATEAAYGGGLILGISHVDRYIGGRFYGEVNYFGLPLFDIVGMGLNLDMLVNFVYSKNWQLGGFIGIGGGMYLGFLKSSLNSAGNVPLSVAGWTNAGFRITFFNHAIELAYRFPYTFASIYNYTTTVQGADGSESYNESYKIKSHSISLYYTFSF